MTCTDDTLRTVRLYGRLGAKFGRIHRLAVSSCAEAAQALAVLLPGFEAHILASKDQGVGYACFLGKRNLAADRLGDPAGADDIRIAPITQGGDFARHAGFAVTLTGTGCKTQGVALVNKIRMLDLTARKTKKIERVPQVVLDDAISRLMALFEV